MGRFSSWVYKKMYIPGTISPGTICNVRIISSGTDHLHDKNYPAFAAVLVQRTGISLCRNGTKNLPFEFFLISISLHKSFSLFRFHYTNGIARTMGGAWTKEFGDAWYITHADSSRNNQLRHKSEAENPGRQTLRSSQKSQKISLNPQHMHDCFCF